MDKWIIDPKEDIIQQVDPAKKSYLIHILLISIIFAIIYLIYYAFKYNANKSNYIIPTNAVNYKLHLDNIIKDIQNAWINIIDQFKKYRERVIFESHYTKGVFYKNNTTDLVDSFISS